MPLKRGVLSAAFALALGVPALAQSAGYDAVFGGGLQGSGLGYSQVFGGSGSDRGPAFVSPLFGEREDPRLRRPSLWDSGSSGGGVSSRLGASGRFRQDFDFIDSFDGLHSAGSADFMGGIGVVSGSRGGAADVDTMHGGVTYAGRGASAYLNSLGGRDVNDSFVDPSGKQAAWGAASRRRADVSGLSDLNAQWQNLGVPPEPVINYSMGPDPLAYSRGNPDLGRPSNAANPASSGYDLVFGGGSAAPRTADYVDPLTPGGGYTTSAALGRGASAAPAYGYSGSGAHGSSPSGLSGSIGRMDYVDPLAPSPFYGAAAPAGALTGYSPSARTAGATGASGGGLLQTYGAASLTDPLGDYRRK